MDISTSIADALGPQRIGLESTDEQALAIDAVLALAQRRVRVFDHDLSSTGWSGAARARLLQRFLLASPRNRLDVLLRDTRFLESRCPRLRTLQTRFSHLVTVHACSDASIRVGDPMLIVDDAHFVHRHHFDAPTATAGLFLPHEAGLLLARFEVLWADSSPAVPPTTLGL